MRKGSPPPPQQQQQQAPSSSSPAQKSAAPPSTAPSHHGSGVAGFTGSDFAGYRVGDPVGKGSMAQVRVAHHEKTGVKVAFKVISRKRIEEQCRALQAQSAQGVDSTAGDAAARGAKASLPTNIVAAKIALEVKVLSLLKHPHIIRLYDVIFTSTDVILVLEYASGGELFDYLNNFGRFAENQARALFQQLMSALEYCHANRVAHRDLKPENLLLDSGNWCIKLTDFDLAARVVDGQLFDMSCGTPNYAAPEVIAGQQYNGTEADTWSAGVVLFAMLTGTLPFDDEQIQTLFRKIREGAFKIPSWVSPPAKDLLRRMLVVDPLQRATIHQILAHPWLRTNIPRYIVDIHEACLRQASGIGVHDMVSQSGPYWDGYRHHVVSPLFNNATAPSATDGMPRPAQSPTKRRRFAQMLGSVDDFSSLHLQQAIGMDAPNPAESSLFPPPPTGVSPLDLDVIAHVADLWKSTSSLVEAAVHRAMLRREYDQTVQLHLLVHGRPPLSPPPLPPTDNSVDPTNDHDLLVTYVILRHRKRAEASTRHRDPAHSVSLGAEVSTSLREGQTASSLNQVHSASHAIDLQRYSAMANILGQGSLSGSLRPILVGKNAVAPAPSASITSVFTGGATAASFDALRMLDPASAFKEGDTTDSSRGSSHHATSKTVVVRQPPPLPEPVSIRIAAIPHYVYNGVARRPGLMQMRSPQPSSSEPLFGDARSPADAEEDVAIPKAPLHSYLPASTVPSVVLEMSAATRQQEEQQRQLGTLLDKPPQFAEYAGAAASEVWAQTFRLGVMSDELTAPSTFTKVFKVLKQQGYVWKVIRPYYVCAVCHCSKTKLFISLLKCSASVSEKFILDVRLAPCCPMSALWRVAETMEAFALSLSGPASIPQAPASLRRAAQQQLSLSPYPSAAIHQ